MGDRCRGCGCASASATVAAASDFCFSDVLALASAGNRTMAADVESRPRKCRLNQHESVSLHDVLVSFNSPLNEEHAWALCFMCAKCFKNALQSDNSAKCKVVSDVEQVYLHREGYVHPSTIFGGGGISDNAGGSRISGPPEHKVVAGLGLVVFKALDFGLEEEEERHLHPELDKLLQDMTRTELRLVQQHAETDDEGIERDSGDSEDDLNTFTSLDQVLQYCEKHVPQPAEAHYRAVCRALVAEAIELSSFLDRVSQGKVKAESVAACTDLQSLHLSDWARLWVQVIRELRHGVQLKKVCYSHTPIEYELTPYEILMDDIRSRRYKLNKVMVDGNIPHRVKKDAHAVILEFIRSRPPLRKASERKLAPRARPPRTPRESLLESITQGQVKLRPTPRPFKKKVVPFDESNQPDATPLRGGTRRLIKVDFSALQMDDDEEEEEELNGGEDGCGGGKERTPRPNPWHRTGTAAPAGAGPLTRDEYHSYCDTALECTLPPQAAYRVTAAQGCRIL